MCHELNNHGLFVSRHSSLIICVSAVMVNLYTRSCEVARHAANVTQMLI